MVGEGGCEKGGDILNKVILPLFRKREKEEEATQPQRMRGKRERLQNHREINNT